ncbi:MAG: DUF3553 domain-containing protein [Planctomycetota bacterium]|jgi:hypothetical protein
MKIEKFSFGDRVRHASRPEWGTGTVVRAEDVTNNGHFSQRIAVRFANAGLKTLNTAHAAIERCSDESEPVIEDDRVKVSDLEGLEQSEWLAPVAERKIQEAMTALPTAVRDPFNSLARRIALTVDLYRFDRSGASLVDWAVAQTGLDDPLTRFTRHELEVHFDRWALDRDAHLRALLQEASHDAAALEEGLAKAPEAGRDAVRRLSASR